MFRRFHYRKTVVRAWCCFLVCKLRLGQELLQEVSFLLFPSSKHCCYFFSAVNSTLNIQTCRLLKHFFSLNVPRQL